MADKFRNKYRIKTARAAWHQYNGGEYFVTICTKNRECYFGEIVDGNEPQMQLSEMGKCANDNFINVSTHHPYAEIPLFVVMPNYIHAIVVIDGEKTPYDRRIVETRHATFQQSEQMINTNIQDYATFQQSEQMINTNIQDYATFQQSEQMTNIANMQGWLSVVIGGLKSAITRYANANKITFSWQSLFYDRIIRDQDELNRIAKYIENNVFNWNTEDINNLYKTI